MLTRVSPFMLQREDRLDSGSYTSKSGTC